MGRRRRAALSHEFADLEDGYGYLIETSHASPGVDRLGGAVGERARSTRSSWRAAPDHRGVRPADPRPRPRPGDDRRRRQPGPHATRSTTSSTTAHFRHGLRSWSRLHEAAGAQEICTLHRKLHALARAARTSTPTPQRVHDAPLTPYEHATFSLHHMGSARMGNDPATSVADPWGELHDTPGRVDRRRQRLPDRVRHEPDAHDHGARAPHGGGDRRGDLIEAEGRPVFIVRALMPYFKHDGHRLAYTVYGEGPRTVVLLHGLLLSQTHARAAGRASWPSAATASSRSTSSATARSDRPRDMRAYSMAAVRRADRRRCSTTSRSTRPWSAGTSLGANVDARGVAARRPSGCAGMVIEMPVLDNALLGCAIAFTPLMVALTFGEPAMKRASSRPPARVPSRRLPFWGDVVLDWPCARIPAPAPPCCRACSSAASAPHAGRARGRSRRRRWSSATRATRSTRSPTPTRWPASCRTRACSTPSRSSSCAWRPSA